MKMSWLSATLLAATAIVTTPARGEVDPALVGTWHLQGGIANVFWVVRPSGDYRLHGPGVRPAQRGRFDSGGGKWSVSAPGWQDAGTYRLQDARSARAPGSGFGRRINRNRTHPAMGVLAIGSSRLRSRSSSPQR
jgi:hypothetical protein